ncbi:MAG: (Fe-S)-binding protein [Deltaproteobacteria bacterium]|jgi:Fe-S oxidoreductase|nr:(Fe-S)-binding protein [Deltaproteobacteria bacterium]
MKPVVFAAVLLMSLAFFGRTIHAMVRAAGRGVADPRPRLDQLESRIGSVLIYFFGQKKVIEEAKSYHHLLIFYGFLVITAGTAELILNGLFPSFDFSAILPGFLYTGFKASVDIMNLVVLAAVVYALLRRTVFFPVASPKSADLIPMNLDAALILGAIASLMVTHYLYHGLHAVAAGAAPLHAPVSEVMYSAFAALPAGKAHFVSEAAYWLHMLILFAFLNYLPYSKHIHLLGAMPNILTRNLSDQKLDLPKLDLEDENQWGVGRVEQFSWKSIIDTYACTECARCSDYCPAYATGKNLSPMQLIHDIRYEAVDRDAARTEVEALQAERKSFEVDGEVDSDNPDLQALEKRISAAEKRLEAMPEMVGERIAEDTLWACTTCGACQEVCPVFIEHPLKIIQMRQNLVLEQEKTPGDLGRIYRNIERQSNPWGIGADKRTEWMADIDVKTIEDHPDPEYILWVGCAGAFDNRIIKQTKAMVKILNAAEVSYAVLGHLEGCTGDPARRSGNEMLFQMQAETNVETLNEAGAKKVIASCPHCLHTLKNDYPQFGGNYEVIHHTQLLAHLMDSGDLKLDASKKGPASITYHDSCYLGRWNNEYEAPRKILEGLPIAGGVTELERNKRHGFCCGAGGGRMFMEEEGERVNVNRTEEVIDAGVEAVAVACPFCNIMLTDGMKTKDKDEDIKVLDVAELLADSLPDVPADSLVRKRPSDSAPTS